MQEEVEAGASKDEAPRKEKSKKKRKYAESQ
jgi:hypothetical protein